MPVAFSGLKCRKLTISLFSISCCENGYQQSSHLNAPGRWMGKCMWLTEIRCGYIVSLLFKAAPVDLGDA
jgi:hypothetical protein